MFESLTIVDYTNCTTTKKGKVNVDNTAVY